MSYKIYILESAEQDLIELKNYVVKNFSFSAWKITLKKINDTILNLKTLPFSGLIPEEMEQLQLTQYRQVISDKNRIIYEIREKNIYIHLVIDTRRDMSSFLTKRLLRIH